MRWEILTKLKIKNEKVKNEDIVEILLKNRGLKTKKQQEEFLNPKKPEELGAKDFGLEKRETTKAIKRIRQAIEKNEAIIVYGDYDTDGICATAILWETLYKLTKNVLPYIPQRVSEGYGLNKKTITSLKEKNPNLKLIITVDHGITAGEKIKFAKKLGIDVVVCDHHEIGKEKPQAVAVVHTVKVCSAAIAWFLSNQIKKGDFLDLVAIATIADVEPLIGVNRSLVKEGLYALNRTKRCGLLAIFEEAGIKQGEIGPYEVGFIIAPRLNAMGRMEHALESLRLVCTSRVDQAKDLATKLGMTNRERQILMEETAKHARDLLFSFASQEDLPKLIFLAHESYQEGIIGLTAGKLVEEFYRPAIVISKGEIYSKASARSINGFNIIEAIRTCSDLLVDAGGHPMAAGFTVETTKLEVLKTRLEEVAQKQLDDEKLTKKLKIDCELSLKDISLELYQEIRKFEPFGLGNPEPIFVSRGVEVVEARTVGLEGKHLKLSLTSHLSPITIEAIGFGMGQLFPQLPPEKPIEIAYSLALDQWNGMSKIQLKLKDIKWEKD